MFIRSTKREDGKSQTEGIETSEYECEPSDNTHAHASFSYTRSKHPAKSQDGLVGPHDTNKRRVHNLHFKLNVYVQVTAIDIVKLVGVHIPTEKNTVLNSNRVLLCLRQGLGPAQKHSRKPNLRSTHTVKTPNQPANKLKYNFKC